ncbi:MAG: hypothetical protein ACW98W_18335 [Candidatus Hodarchaeales archaeon]|jgi:ABC-type multidrug transport system permease subunit
MNKFFAEIENRVSDDWKFAIKNASLLIILPLFIILIITIVSTLITGIFISTEFRDILTVILFLAYMSGFFIYTVVIFKIILNFINYYKEK